MTEGVPRLYRHTSREAWGLGIVLRKESDRVHVQFQDGQARAFKKGYYHLLEPVDRRLDVTMSIVDALRAMSGDTAGRRQADRVRPISLDDQIAFFSSEYAGGFQSEAYTTEHRGDGRKRPLKRHRDALVAAASRELGRAALQRLIKEDAASEVHAAAVRVLDATDLVKVAERKRFGAISEDHYGPFANALFVLLHGQSSLTARLDAFVPWLERAMGEPPSWVLSTLFLGALRPQDHVVVRETVFAKQAAWMAPGLTIPKRPMGILYERLLSMAQSVREHLESAGLEPRDLLDVQDFAWATLKPAAQRAIRETRGPSAPRRAREHAQVDHAAA